MVPDEKTSASDSATEYVRPEPSESGTTVAQQVGSAILPEVVTAKRSVTEKEEAAISADPLLSAISQTGVRGVALGIAQHLLSEIARKDIQLEKERNVNSDLEKQLREEQRVRASAEGQVLQLRERRILGTALIVFGSIVLGIAGFIYKADPHVALLLASLDIAMTAAGIVL